MKTLLFIIILVFANVSLAQKTNQNQTFSFKGISLGISPREFKKIATPTSEPADIVCSSDTDSSKKGFLDLLNLETSVLLKELGGDSCVYTNSVLFFRYLSLYYGFYFIKMPKDTEAKLFRMWMDIHVGDYDELLSELTKKYGKPRTTTQKVSNRMNAKFNNVISVWENKENQITLTKYASNLESSYLQFTYKEYDKYFSKLQKEHEKNKPSKI